MDKKIGFIEALKRFKLELRWATDRIITYLRFLEAARDARVLELKWQKMQQEANDLAQQGNTLEAVEMRGFIEGIKYCISREWKNEK